MSVNSTNPTNLFGGTWQQLKDRFLLGVGDTYKTVNSTGGESSHTLTVNEMPKHHHDVYIKANQVSALGDVVWVEQYDANNTTVRCTETGGNQPHNNMPPYLVVYMWKRTA